jgi:hypothetical protein
MRIDVELGGTTLRTIIGSLLLVASVTGCAESGASAPASAATAQKECERSGGTWRGARCETSAGGGY